MKLLHFIQCITWHQLVNIFFKFVQPHHVCLEELTNSLMFAKIKSLKNNSISNINDELPKLYSTPELNISVTDENKFKIIEDFSSQCSLQGEKITIDGLRINFQNGWGLIRASNTTPKLVMRFEGNSIEALNDIQNDFINELSRISPNIDINLE